MAKKIIFTNSQIETLKRFANQGYTIVDIAKYFEVNRVVIYRLLKENSVILVPSNKNKKGKPIVWTDNMISRLKEMYLSNLYSLSDIVKEFKISKHAIGAKASELGLHKVSKKFFTEEEDIFLKENASKMSLKDLSEKLNKCDETIAKELKNLGIKERKGNSIYFPKKGFDNPKSIQFPDDEEFYEDLKNPIYSHTYLSKKYSYSVSTISKWRKMLFGNFKTMVDTFLCKSSAEIDFENKILIPLDLAYFYEYKIDNWKIDYNLGHHLLIEIQSDYYHKLPKVIEKDTRKKEYLEKLGYTILYFWEKDLKNIKLVKSIIVETLKRQIEKWSLNLMN